jgi:hypothetical protein
VQTSPRIAQLADQIVAKTLAPEQVPTYDREVVQEELLRRFLNRTTTTLRRTA